MSQRVLVTCGLLLTTSFGCFNFAEVKLAGVGDRCGDGVDRFCNSDDHLRCRDGVCVRSIEGSLGDTCDTRSVCGAALRCDDGVCVDHCDGVTCSQRGVCENDGTKAVCVCSSGYIAEGLACLGQLGQACTDDARCASSFACVDGLCVDACLVIECGRNAACSTAQGPPACVCDAGFNSVQGQCTNACVDVSCSGHGICQLTGGDAACVCDNGYSAAGLDCVQTTCTPTTHATTNCDSGHVYWYDSCGAREGVAENCGNRGCTGGTCIPIAWKNRNLSLTGSLYVSDVIVASNDELIAVGTDGPSITVRRWNGSWGEFAPGASTFAPPKAAFDPVLGLDAANAPIIVYATTFERTGYFPTHEIFLQRWTGAWTAMADSATYDANYGGLSHDFHLESESPRVIVDAGGSPVVAWIQDVNDISVARWDGIGWARTSGQAYKTSSISSLSIAPLQSGGEILLWQEGSGTSAKIHARSTLSSGIIPGGEPTVDSGALAPSLAIHGDEVHVAWQKDGEIRYRRWSNGSWIDALPSASGGSGISATAAESSSPAMATDAIGRPVIAWIEKVDAQSAVFIKRWNGTAWVEAGASAASGSGLAALSHIRITTGGDTICLFDGGSIRCATF